MSTKKNILSVIVGLLLVNILLMTAGISSSFPDLKNFIFTRVIPSELTELTNASRKEAKLDVLKISPILTRAAQAKALDMVEKGYFAHTSPDNKTPWYWLKQEGYNYIYAGENLAVRFTRSEDVSKAWMNSIKHRNNILDTEFTEMGIATAEGFYKGKEATFVVQMFAEPMPKIGAALLGPETGDSEISAVAEFMGDDKGKELYMEYEPAVPSAWSVALKIVNNLSEI